MICNKVTQNLKKTLAFHPSRCVHVVSAGDAGEAKQQRSGFCGQGFEEGHHFAR